VEEEALGKAYDSRLMRRLLAYVAPYRVTVGISLVFLLFNSFFQIVGPLLTKLAVDRYLVPTGKPMRTPLDGFLSADPRMGIAQIALVYLLAILGGLLCDFGETYLMQWTGQKAMFDLRRQLMAKLQQLDVSFFDRNPVGRLVTRVTTDVDVLNELFSSGLLMIIGDLLMLSFVVLAMFQMSPGMTGILLSVMPIVLLVTRQFRRAVQTSYGASAWRWRRSTRTFRST
jgi:ATP-binding cassette subfamily B protein